eukprot:8435878-Pyramimonas_sp.AAC.1
MSTINVGVSSSARTRGKGLEPEQTRARQNERAEQVQERSSTDLSSWLKQATCAMKASWERKIHRAPARVARERGAERKGKKRR